MYYIKAFLTTLFYENQPQLTREKIRDDRLQKLAEFLLISVNKGTTRSPAPGKCNQLEQETKNIAKLSKVCILQPDQHYYQLYHNNI